MKRFLLVIILAVAACALGPDYVVPSLHLAPKWKEAPFASNPKAAIDEQWWKNFNDSVLDELIARGLANNLDVKMTVARVKEARAERLGVIVDQLPEVNATAGANRTQNSHNTFSLGGGKPFDAFNTAFDASWEANIFGGRRAIEAANATLEAAQESQHDVIVTLLGDIASQYIAVRNYQNQIKVAEDNLAAQRDTLALTQSRNQAGLVSNIDATQAEALVQATESDIPALRASMHQSLHALEILLGEQPGTLENIVTTTPSVPISTNQIVAAAPADILRNRPDIRQAERELAAATAVQGVALAEIYPKISLTSTFGLGSAQTSTLFNGASKTWSLGTGAVLPILDFGRIRSDIDIADARQEQAFLNYQKTVLNGLKEVENALIAYYQEEARLASIDKEVQSQETATQLIDERYRKGLTSFLNVLDTKRSLYAAQLAQAQSRAKLSTDLIMLYKALGGGWQNEQHG